MNGHDPYAYLRDMLERLPTQANPGARVIVRLDDHHEVTFKQLLIEGGSRLLKALNPEWAPRYIEINGNATITGVVIGKWVSE